MIEQFDTRLVETDFTTGVEAGTPEMFVDNVETSPVVTTNKIVTMRGNEEMPSDSPFKIAYMEAKLKSGADLHETSIKEVFGQYEDYSDNQKYYDAVANMNSKEYARMYDFIARGEVALDGDKIVKGENGSNASLVMYDLNAMKGLLLSKRNGFNDSQASDVYARQMKERSLALEEKRKSMGSDASDVAGYMAGGIAAYLANPNTIIDFASPSKIIAPTIAKGMTKAFGIEFALGALSETARQRDNQLAQERAGNDFDMWEATKEILMNGTFAGTIRSVGSGIVDANTLRILAKGTEHTPFSREILDNFAYIANTQLSKNTNTHLNMLQKVEAQIDEGKPVEVDKFADITIDEAIVKLDPEVIPNEEINLHNELENLRTIEDKADEAVLLDEINEIKPIEKYDTVEEFGVTKQQADDLIKEQIDNLPTEDIQAFKAIEEEIKSLKKRELTDKQRRMKEAKTPEIGGSEDEAKEKVLAIMNEKELNSRYKNMSKDDIAELDRMYKEEEARVIQEEADALFAKGGDNIAGGLIAGIEEDENGNISLDPVKFIAGLGGYTAVKAMLKNPTISTAFKDQAFKALEKVEDI